MLVLTNPINVIKSRFEVVGFNKYHGIYDAATKIYSLEGLKGFTVGTNAMLLRDVPYSGIYYPLYEAFKLFYQQAFGLEKLSEYHQNNRINVFMLTSIATISSLAIT